MFKEDESKLMFTVFVCLSVLAAVAIHGTWNYYATVASAAMKEGYSQQTLPGQSGVFWVKDGVKSPQQ